MSILIECGMLTIAKGVHLGKATEATGLVTFFVSRPPPAPLSLRSLWSTGLPHIQSMLCFEPRVPSPWG